jgi:hypothetical protein
MEPKIEERIPMFIESERGDDKMGTGPDGALITDNEAIKAGVDFAPGVPQDKIQEAVEGQLRDDKWVVLEKGDGKTELLTKRDLPKPEEVKEEEVASEELSEEVEEPEEVDETHTEETETGGEAGTPPKPEPDDCRSSFGKPPEPKSVTAARNAASVASTKASPVIKSGTCNAQPKGPIKPVEKWESKFDNVKSATATHKGKGG